MHFDRPKSLANPAERLARNALLQLPHIEPLTAFVERLRQAMGPEYGIPYLDPLDGGVNAQIMFLLEAPGPKAVEVGFISRNNPDETARNFFQLNEEAGIPRQLTVSWNVVPWYIGTGTKIRAAKSSDISKGVQSLSEFIGLLPELRQIVFIGAKAAKARPLITSLKPTAAMLESPHPSPLFVNNAPGNRERIAQVLRQVARGVAR
jgi:uracil-DNA glycosylase